MQLALISYLTNRSTYRSTIPSAPLYTIPNNLSTNTPRY